MTDNPFFDKAFDQLMVNEGGYINHPRDPGGETMYGVTKRVAIKHGYKGSMRDLPKSFAKEVAKKSYWDAAHCDEFAPAVAAQVFDAAYNHGPNRAIKFLQQAAGITGRQVDGIVGPKTIGAVNNMPADIVVFKFLAKRLDFFTRLGTWSAFGKGWSRRIVEQLEAAAAQLDWTK